MDKVVNVDGKDHLISEDKPRGVKTKDFGEGWEQRLYKLGSRGGTMQEMAALLKISQWQFKHLVGRDEYFEAVVITAEELAEAWWLKNGRTNLTNKQFHPSLYYMNMKNRYGWKDRQDITSKDEQLPTPILAVQNTVNTNEIEKEIEEDKRLEQMTQKERYAANKGKREEYKRKKQERLDAAL